MINFHKLLTRRDFIRGTVGASLAASVMDIPWPVSALGAAKKSIVHVVREEKVMNISLQVNTTILRTMIDKAVMEITDKSDAKTAWNELFTPDDIVGLVNTPHLNPTHPEMLQAVRSSLTEYAKIPENNIRDAQGGIRHAIKCSALISIPALKAHWLTGIGTVIKNYIMYSGRPALYHKENSARLGEIWNLPGVKGKTRLILVDALHPLCDKGPQPDPRYKWAYNGIICGTDPVAVETICLKIISAKRNALRGEPWPLSPPPLCIEAADQVYGLGTSDLNNITVRTFGWGKDLLV